MDRPLKSTPGCPHKGWQWLRAVNLRDTPGSKPGKNKLCEFCKEEKTQIVHHLRHPDWKRILVVGRKCAKALTGDPRIETAERDLHHFALRKNDFIHHKGWRESDKGNYWIEYQGHHIIVVAYRPGHFRLRINDVAGRLSFTNPVAAMGKAFDVIEMKQADY